MTPADTAPEKVVLRDADGTITEDVFLKDGAMEGEALIYTDGRLRGRLMYRGGKQQGLSIYYSETGQVSMTMNYANGKLEGESVYFDAENKPIRRALYEKGLLQGRSIDYYPSGKARTVSHYRGNILHGEVWQYSEDGKLQERLCYNEGKPYPCPPTRSAPAATRRG